MIRFILSIAFHLIWCLRFTKMMKKQVNNPDATAKENHAVAQFVVKKITEKGRITVERYGYENLPKEDGFVLYPNHEGRFDGLAIYDTFDRPLSVVLDQARSDISIEKYFIDMVKGIRIDRTNARNTIRAINELGNRIQNGNNYFIFPEGAYDNNKKNTLTDFNTGCMHFLHKVKCPIVPVCLYDTYKVYNVNSLKKVKCSVHYLDPIYYDEYKELGLKEISELVKERIQNKINELDIKKGNN